MSDVKYDFGVPLPPAKRGKAANGSMTSIIRNLPADGSKFFCGEEIQPDGQSHTSGKTKTAVWIFARASGSH